MVDMRMPPFLSEDSHLLHSADRVLNNDLMAAEIRIESSIDGRFGILHRAEETIFSSDVSLVGKHEFSGPQHIGWSAIVGNDDIVHASRI